MELKQQLQAAGAHFTSETDVEVIAHLIAADLDVHGLVEATRRTYNRLRRITPSSPSPPRSPACSSVPARSAR